MSPVLNWSALWRVVVCGAAASLLLWGALDAGQAAEPLPRIKLLFLGDQGHHKPAERFAELQPVFARRGIDLTYTEKVDDLNQRTLSLYHGVVIFANIVHIEPAQEEALLTFVRDGRALIALHCASYCFHNSPKYIALVGAQFQKHGTGEFRTENAAPDHPVMRGFGGFESWDETYVHTKHNEQGRTVLEFRAEGAGREPWTWVRGEGKGRVFYTAWGHDQRTWGHPGFQNLVERGVRWAVGADPASAGDYPDVPRMTQLAKDVKPFEYVEAEVPFYPAGKNWGTVESGKRQMQLPLEPAESMKHYVMPEGFELQLFVSEPDLQGKPIAMNWDERGRLWVLETVDYPNELQPAGKGRDRIRICEDTDGDGRADRFTVFADKLSIPTSLAFARGGVIVHQAPDTLFLRDTNGDDVADERRVLFTGWITNDTHAGPSNLHYGLDNWLYGMVGYAGFRGQVGNEQHDFRTGFYRFKPDGSQFEFLRNTNNNSWGVGFSEEGILFGSTANGNPSVHMPIPNRYYERVRGWSSSVLGTIATSSRYFPITEKIREVDHHGGFTAAAGHALYTARTYPRQYWNRTAFVTDPTGHLAATFVIEPRGASFVSRNSWNLVAADDEWAAPIMAEVGPDGCVWVIDWYNYIVQHNPTPAGFKTGKGNAYETNLRDKKHGRIYRLVYRGGGKQDPINLAAATPAQLVETLRHPNLFWRRHAQRLLVERGNQDVVPALTALLDDRKVDEIGLNVGVIHALWTLHGLGALDSGAGLAAEKLAACQKHPSAGVRRNAHLAMVAPGRDSYRNLATWAGLLAEERDPQVRLAMLLRASDLEPSEALAGQLVLAAREPGFFVDRWIEDAYTSAAAGQGAAFLRRALATEEGAGQKFPPQMATVVERVAEHVARGPERAQLVQLLDRAAAAPANLQSAFLAGATRGWPRSGAEVKLTEAQEKQLVAWLGQLTPAGRGELIALVGKWGISTLEKYTDELARQMAALAENENAGAADRVGAARQLVQLKPDDAAAADKLLGLITPRMPPELAVGIVEAVAGSKSAATGVAIVKRLGGWTPAVRAAGLRALVGRNDWVAALLDGLEAGKARLDDLALDQKQALAVHADPAIAARAKKLLAMSGGLPDPDRQKVVEAMLPLTKQKGDPALGKQVYLKQCAKCHVHGAEGQRVGPDLTGMAVHPKHELLIHILDPSRSVEGNFRVYRAETSDGRVFTGLLASESKTSIELVDAEGKKLSLLREDLEALDASTKSLMPEGFEKQVPPEDLVHLLEFLTQRGKYLPLPLAKAATIVSTRGMFYDEASDAERIVFSDWTPKTFQGIPFQLVDPRGDQMPNVILLHGPEGKFPPRMPKAVTVPCNAPAKAIHILGGISGWGFPLGTKGSVSLIVRLHYEDGTTEDHPLKNGEHLADYIRRVDVPASTFAFAVRGQQVRYLAVHPQRPDAIREIEFVKGTDRTAPVVVAVTVEAP